MNGKRPARDAVDLHLPPGDRAIAQDTDTLVVERMPFPAQIDGLEKRELVFWAE